MKKIARDLTDLRVGDSVWCWSGERWNIDSLSGRKWFEHEIVDENRSFWIVGVSKWRVPKRIYEGDHRGIAWNVLRGNVAFSERERDVLGWVKENRSKISRALDTASGEQLLAVAKILGIPKPRRALD